MCVLMGVTHGLVFSLNEQVTNTWTESYGRVHYLESPSLT